MKIFRNAGIRTTFATLATVWLLLGGCGKSDSSPGDQEPQDEATMPICEDGDQRCADGGIAVCNGGTWSVGQMCGAPEICAETSSTTATCMEPGTLLLATAGLGRKIQPTTEPGALVTARLAGPRRSVQAFQIAVHGNGGPLEGATVEASDLESSASTIAATNITVFRAHFIDFAGVDAIHGILPAPDASPTNDSRVPDPLIPLVDPYTGNNLGQPFLVGPELNEVLFVDVAVPADADPGIYTGAVTVSTGDESVDVPIELEVWDITLPDLNVIKTYFTYHNDTVKYFHADTYTCYGGDTDCWADTGETSLRISRRYADLLHNHRVDPGQGFLESPESDDECSVPTDWSAYDASLQPYMDGSYFSDGVPSGRIDVPFVPGADWGPQTDCTQQEYTALAAAWAAHLKEKGWFDKAVVYAVDEPVSNEVPFELIAENAQWMKDGDPDWKARIMDTVSAHEDSIDILEPALGIFCQALTGYADWYYDGYYGRTEWESLFSGGTELWFYESNNQGDPYPTFASNSLDGLEPTMLMWGSWYEHATGFLLWATAAWNTNDPWGPNIDYGKSGDGVLVYPGHHNGLEAPFGSPDDIEIDGPIPSYRLKMIRTGLQDWALFHLAEESGVGEVAREQVHRVYRQLGGCDWEGCPVPEGNFFWHTDEALMEEIRATVATAIMGR